MAVGQKQQLHLVSARLEPGGAILRRIDQNPGIEQKETISVEDASRERIDDHAVQFRASPEAGRATFAGMPFTLRPSGSLGVCASIFFCQLVPPLSQMMPTPMTIFRTLLWPTLAVSLASLVSFGADEPDPGQVQISVGKLLEQGHYSRKKLDDSVSRQLLKNYLDALDYNRSFFTQKDVDAITAKHATTLDDDILLGNPEPAFKIHEVYRKRVEDRVAKVKTLLEKTYDFTSDRTIEVNRQKAAWPKDDEEADRIWRDRIEGELLQETLNKKAINPPVKRSRAATIRFCGIFASRPRTTLRRRSSPPLRRPTTLTPTT
jgi:hypothetical protein